MNPAVLATQTEVSVVVATEADTYIDPSHTEGMAVITSRGIGTVLPRAARSCFSKRCP